jgi:hypothetical protein
MNPVYHVEAPGGLFFHETLYATDFLLDVFFIVLRAAFSSVCFTCININRHVLP